MDKARQNAQRSPRVVARFPQLVQPFPQEKKSNAVDYQSARVRLLLPAALLTLLPQKPEHALCRRRVGGDVHVDRSDTRRTPQVVFESLLDDTAARAAIGVEAINKIHHRFRRAPPVGVLMRVCGGGGGGGGGDGGGGGGPFGVAGSSWCLPSMVRRCGGYGCALLFVSSFGIDGPLSRRARAPGKQSTIRAAIYSMQYLATCPSWYALYSIFFGCLRGCQLVTVKSWVRVQREGTTSVLPLYTKKKKEGQGSRMTRVKSHEAATKLTIVLIWPLYCLGEAVYRATNET